MQKISTPFLIYASDILADTETGLSGGRIVQLFNAKSVEYGVDIPHCKMPFAKGTPNKRTVFFENLEKFSSEQQFEIIDETIENSFSDNKSAKELKRKLYSQYKSLAKAKTIVESELVQETSHWLKKYENSYKPFASSLEKFSNKIYERNLLDDLRLSLELLLKSILKNNKSIENQLEDIGKYQNAKGMSSEITNMFKKLLDYYGKYQNNYVKHNDLVKPGEIEFIIDLTSSFMKFLIKGEK